MATTKNSGSLFLAAANPRLLVPGDAALFITASSNVFHVNTSGTPDSASIQFAARMLSIEGVVAFSVTGGTLSAVSGNTATLAYTDMASNVALITATITYRGTTFTDTKVVSKVVDVAGSSGLNNAIAYAYQRSVTAPTLSPGAITYDFTSASISTASLANGWFKTIPSGTDPLYITAASASAAGTTDTIASTEWSSAVVLSQNGTSGSNGLSVATVFIYRRTATNVAPALPSVGTTFTFSSGALTGLDNGWSTAVPVASSTAFLWVTTATAASTTATDTVLSTEWAAAQLMAQDGVSGVNNTVVYAYQRSATAPTLTPGAVTYDFTSGAITTTTLTNGWLKAIPTGSDPLYVTVASASSTSTTDSIGSAEWSAAVVLAQNGTNGNNGLNVATVFIYQRTASTSAPALPSADTIYTFATGGLTGLTNSWTTFVPAASGGAYLWVSTSTASNTTTTDTIVTSEWAAAQIMAQDGVSTGIRGAGTYYATGSVWDASVADAATPGTNLVDDIVVISNGTNFVSTRRWDGSAWAVVGTVIDGVTLANGSVTAAKINSNGLVIRDTLGNIILGAGSALDWAKLTATGLSGASGILNSNVSLGTLGYSGAYNATYNPGAFANLSGTITAANAATYFAANSIDGTYIANLAANKITVGTLTGFTIQTATSGRRVTINESSSNSLKIYDLGGTQVGEFGGSGSAPLVTQAGASIPGVQVTCASSSTAAIITSASAGNAILAQSSGSGAGLSASSSSSGPGITVNGSGSSNAINITGGANSIVITGSGGCYMTTLLSAVDGSYSLGNASFRWNNVYATSGVVNTSDARTKTGIRDTPLGLDFIMRLRGVAYKMLVAENIVTTTPGPDVVYPGANVGDPDIKILGEPTRTVTPRAGTREHYGLIAQEVHTAMVASGVQDAAFWTQADPSDPGSLQALRYDGFIAPLIKAIQEQQALIVSLTTRLTALETGAA